MAAKFSNKLINESSPYLQQHAHNPVDWYPWGEEALNAAKEKDMPILVSIGYSACHWCHVMERESFENEEVAKYMNEHFINIKIDREERPDLDHIYMDAVQAIAGNGGWPLNVFLTQDAKPFYGGTYFPPRKAFNRPSWMDVLTNIQTAWIDRREEITQQANNLVDHISLSSNLFTKDSELDPADDQNWFTKEQCDLIAANILKSADKMHGGFGAAPKFPQTFVIQYLLAYGHFFNDAGSIEHAEFSLQQMLRGGIYDHLAGGLARYSTDAHWLAPHFEKMLYDNALLVSVLSDAYQVTGNKIYTDAIHKTLGFLLNEMKHKDAGFFAALDADSEGEEGKFYVWSRSAIDELLGKDSASYCKWFGVTEKGNWEGKNILNISVKEEQFAAENNMSIDALQELVGAGNKKLLEQRSKRPRPVTDDKILIGWNALLITALCKASAALGNAAYKEEAISLFSFIKEKFSKNGMLAYHTYKNGEAKYPAFLDDFAYLIQACIHLQEISSDTMYLKEARQLTEHVMDHFGSAENGFFYFTNKDQTDVIARKTELYDGAVPSGNSIMVDNLFYLSVIFDNSAWNERAKTLTKYIVDTIVKYPSSFAIWAMVVLKQVTGINEIVITGKDFSRSRDELLRLYLPNKVFQSADKEGEFPLLKHKNYEKDQLIYLCKNYQCLSPVDKIRDLKIVTGKAGN